MDLKRIKLTERASEYLHQHWGYDIDAHIPWSNVVEIMVDFLKQETNDQKET